MPHLCVSSPYISDHLGGGEKYLLDIATQAAELGWQVSLALPVKKSSAQLAEVADKLGHFYGRSLTSLQVISAPWLITGSVVEKWQQTAQFDAFFWITDGSIFLSHSPKNILHFQIPFTQPPSVATRLKLRNWPLRTANSEFTKDVIEHSWKIPVSYIHSPMVKPIVRKTELATLKKKPMILSVGRFFRQLHSKRQDILVEAFRKLRIAEPKAFRNWELVLVGSVEDRDFFESVQHLAEDLPVRFETKLDRLDLEKRYRQASVYWHAAGFGVDPAAHPERVEHFGISTVEAMSAGCIPLVVPAGGQAAVVGPDFQSLSWQSIPELIDHTTSLVKHTAKHAALRQAAYTQATQYGEQPFRRKLAILLSE